MTGAAAQGIAGQASPRKIALYWGSGTYPGDLYNRLMSVPGLSVCILSHLDTLPGTLTSPIYKVTNFSSIQSVLRTQDIHEILFAGGFSFGELFFQSSLRLLASLFTDAVAWRHVLKAGFFQPGRNFLTGTAFYRALQTTLEDCSAIPLSPHDLVDDFKGVNGKNGDKPSLFLIEAYEDVLRRDVSRSITTVTVTQSYVIADDYVVLRERFGTRRLLRRFARKDRFGLFMAPALVKLPARGFNVRLEMPFIGPDTMDQCRKAHIREIVFCTDYTVLYQKWEILRLAAVEPSIALTGMDTATLKKIFADDQEYLAGL